MIKALKDARYNYFWMFFFFSWLFAALGRSGSYALAIWIVALAMVVNLFRVAMVLADIEELLK